MKISRRGLLGLLVVAPIAAAFFPKKGAMSASRGGITAPRILTHDQQELIVKIRKALEKTKFRPPISQAGRVRLYGDLDCIGGLNG